MAKAPSKSEILKALSESTDLSRKKVASVIDGLAAKALVDQFRGL